MDKRRSPRYATSLNALVHPNVGRSWLCTIKDFCDSGMLLVEQEGGRSRRGMPGINPGETVGIHFSVPLAAKDQHFRLEGRIVRVMDSGVGINFTSGMADDAMDALTSHSDGRPVEATPPPKTTAKPVSDNAARRNRGKESVKAQSTVSEANKKKRQPVAAISPASARTKPASNLTLKKKSPFATGGLKPADSMRLVAALREGVVKVMPEMTTALFKYMDVELLEMAKDAKSNAEQSEYFAAMSNLEKAKKKVSEQFAKDILDQIDNPRDLETLLEERKKANDERKQSASAKKLKLSLVNTEEFEDWLAVANIISRSERSYEKYLQELLPRMGMMVDSWGHSEANPLGTAVFCHAFDDAIQGVALSKEIRQKVYSGYEAKVTPLFRKLYIAATKLLEESGLFPDLDDDYITPSSPEPGSTEEESTSEEIEDDAIEDESPVDDEEELENLQNELRDELKRRREGATRDSGDARPDRTSTNRQGSNRGSAGQRQRSAVASSISDIYSTVRNLISSHQDEIEGDNGDQDFVELDEVQGLLEQLQQDISRTAESGMPAQRVPVRQRILENAAIDGRQLAPQAMERLDVVENLVDAIEDDSLLSDSAKTWIRQLELTLGKVATQRQDFLDDENPHRSIDVINQLAQLGGSENASVQRNVQEIIGDINQSFDSNPAVFDDAIERLQPLLDRQSRAFTGNVQRTVKASEGQQTLLNAQRAVVSEMDQRLAGREVPEILMKLLMPGWRNLLVNTHLRQGQDSADWKNHVRALDQVMEHLEGSADPASSDNYIAPDELLQQIESGLDSISFEPGQRAPLVNTLRQILTSDESVSDLPMVDLSKKTVAESLGFADITESEEERRQIREEKQDDTEWNKHLARLEHLHVGEWVEFKDKGGEAEIAIAAWVSEDNTKFVFVNRRGVKTHELSVEELATMMIKGEARIMEESDIPLTDRASHRMLQNMHNELTHQATHDELTGLVNRKEFERNLTRVLGLAKRNSTHHVVAFLDLDQFKVINNTGGHDAGDRLLVELSEEIKTAAPEDTILARLGGDEFGILLENVSKDGGLSIIKQVSDAVKAFRFTWEGEVFSLTTSCGVVNVDSEIESVTSILRGADSACYVAKDAGRDRIQVYETNDKEMAHRKDIMEFVSQIDRSLEEDRFVLNCQMISPIDADSGEDAHYEILLTVLDENDEPMPPQDFIVAAETYNRMGAIDRWVIKNAFKFIASNILRLDHLGAFSINVSGNSLTESDFMEFVLEQFNETRLPTSKICFEITETAAIGNLDDVIEFIEKMKVIGVQFSLDDFGTGLSSYSYLRNLPVDFLKIDGIFVKDIKTSPSDYAVVKSINEIGHFMGKKTIAEYVEDDEVLEILREIGVDYAQGFGVGRKIPITELIA